MRRISVRCVITGVLALICLVATCTIALANKPLSFTVLPYDYHRLVTTSRNNVTQWLVDLNPVHDINQRIIQAGQLLMDRPYSNKGAAGEGDWCNLEQRGCPHIKQDPIYRTDQFDCQTLVQLILAMLYTHHIKDFEQALLQISYGAANEPSTHIHYYNRNNFTSTDFNRINEAHGLLIDATQVGVFATLAKESSATIDPQSWFNKQTEPNQLKTNVRVIHARDGESMALRFSHAYPKPFHQFHPTLAKIFYIPKTDLVKKIVVNGKINYVANDALIKELPTPAVMEVIRNPRKWHYGGLLIQKAIGTELNVSHMGLLYRKTFKLGELIYPKISCQLNKDKKKICLVSPIVCNHANGCEEVMLLHATEAFPKGYYFYRDPKGQFHCEATPPASHQKITTCNRVMTIPLKDYLASFQYGQYIYMTSDAILGIHLEKIR